MKKRIILVLSLIILAVIITGGIIIFQPAKQREVFFSKTTINGIDISGLNKQQAYNKLSEHVSSQAQNIKLDIVYKDKVWSYNGANFGSSANVRELIDYVYKRGKSGNYFQNISSAKKMGMDNALVLNYYFKDIDERLEDIIAEIEQPVIEADIKFYPKKEKMFEIFKSSVGIVVDREKLIDDITAGLNSVQHITVNIKTTEISPKVTETMLSKCTRRVADFSTGFASSSTERRHNIKIAAEAFNGLRLEPGEEYSFNELLGPRTKNLGYKEANIIKDGNYEKGVGGGICQVSTTLYNALILSNIKITQVHSHTLPVSYAPLAQDAMVNWGSADLKFINTSALPVFIKSSLEGDKVHFEVFGATLKEGEYIKIKSVEVGTIPHNGDKIIKDTKGKYADKIMFKGEYIREKFPKVGYEAKSYISKYAGDKLLSENLLRHEKYSPQQGIVYEGTDDLIEGMTLPPNTVKIIPPQKIVR